LKFSILIDNVKGLHARASAKFVEVVESHDADATVENDGMDVPGNSIMGLMMLGASKGTTIQIETSGPEAEKLASALKYLIDDKFGEGE